jgi:Tol biopolymer transport system component
LAFLSDVNGSTELWISDIDGRNPKVLTHDLVSPNPPSWFPDSRTVAYGTAEATPTIWRRSIDQQRPTRLTELVGRIPAIAPDGRSFLCSLRVAELGIWKTALLNVGVNAPPRYFPMIGRGMRWMPDGTAYAFIDDRGGEENIFLQPIRGGQASQITHFQEGRINDYDISRDGKSIVLSHRQPADDMVLIRGFQ